MAKNTTLNAKNLEALGKERLAELLIELSTGNASIKRSLKLELAGKDDPDQMAREISKRLKSLAKSTTFIDWQKKKALATELEAHRRSIVDRLATQDPLLAKELIWQFLGIADSVFSRCDDSSGTISHIFRQSIIDLGKCLIGQKIDREALAIRIFSALSDNGYGQYDKLLDHLIEPLGQIGLQKLKALFTDVIQNKRLKSNKNRVIGRRFSSKIDDVDANEDHFSYETIGAIIALQKIADAEGDVDGYIALQSKRSRVIPAVAASISQRLLAANRETEAWEAINAVINFEEEHVPFEWEDIRCEILLKLGRKDEALEFRRACFARFLNDKHLRKLLKDLPDFEDIEAEESAMTLALSYPDIHRALYFLVEWPNLDKANKLIQMRSHELDGDRYELLPGCAELLAGKYPLAATLIFRSIVNYCLKWNKHTRFKHAARHLVECISLAPLIKDFGVHDTHEAYIAKLKSGYGNKSSFWYLVG